MRAAAIVLAAIALPALAQPIPREAMRYQREFVGINRQVWGLENPAMLGSQIEAESGWRDGLTSSASAKGICQALESTGIGAERQYPALAGLARFSPRWCLQFQALHMRDLYERYAPGRGRCSALLTAFAGYVGSPSTLDREIALCRDDPTCRADRWFGEVSSKQARADRHFRDSRYYVQRIFTGEARYTDAGFGVAFCR